MLEILHTSQVILTTLLCHFSSTKAILSDNIIRPHSNIAEKHRSASVGNDAKYSLLSTTNSARCAT
jgi:hypothetical protein